MSKRIPAFFRKHSRFSQYSQNIKGGHYAAPLPNLLNNLPWSVPGALGLIWLAVYPKKRGWEAMAAVLGAVGLFIFTYWNGRRYPYYALVMAAFAPLGPAAVASLANRLAKDAESRTTAVISAGLGCVLLLASPFIALQASPNTYLMQVQKEEMPQYRFAEIIRQQEDQTLLNDGFLDGGFYFAAGVLPSDPFFCTLNIDLPQMETSMQDSIRQGKTAFVITRSQKLRNSGAYRLVDEASMVFEGRNWTYYLYQRAN